MSDNVSSVEDELQRIEDDFHAGRMNAFGNQFSHERMEKELKKIRELDELIFSRVGTFLERDDTAEWKLRRELEPQPVPEPNSAPGVPTSATSFGMRGVTDDAFANASQYFSDLEREFAEIGDNLRKMSSHVVSLNQLAEASNASSNSGGRR